MDGGPIAVGVLQTGRDLVPIGRPIGFQRILRLRLHAEGDAEIADVADGIALLGENLRECLTGILVVVGNVVIEVGLDGLEHRGPVRPFRRAIIADDVGRFGGLQRRHQRQREQG